MDHPKRSTAAAPSLPDDALVEILSRLPAKSLCRFKCVSRAWRDLIADPLHRRKLPQTLEGFFCGLRFEDGEDGYVGDGYCGGGGHWLDSVFIDLVGRSAPLVDPSFSFLTKKLSGIKSVRILHSCNGLLLLGTARFYTITCPRRAMWCAIRPRTNGWPCPAPVGFARVRQKGKMRTTTIGKLVRIPI